jgi:hypothetical protein
MGAFIHNLHASQAPYDAITYPQRLERCEGCHLAGTFNAARTTALPVTVDPGPNGLAWQDDLADSATAGTCKACHAEATGHMQQQGGSFAQPKTLSPSSAVEGCAVCHGAGSTYDTKAMHCGLLPFGQCSQ